MGGGGGSGLGTGEVYQRPFTSTCLSCLLVGRRRILWLPGDAVIHLCVAFTINRKRERRGWGE